MIGASAARLSTSVKMLLILTIALLPLGLIAIYASLESARTNRVTRDFAVRMMAADSTRRLDTAIGGITRDMVGTMLQMGDVRSAAACRRSLDTLAATQPAGIRFGLFYRGGRKLCATTGFVTSTIAPPAAGMDMEATLEPGQRWMRLATARNDLIVAAEIPLEPLARITAPTSEAATLILWQGDTSLQLAGRPAPTPSTQTITVASPVADGQLALELRADTAPIRAIEWLMVLLPILMWLAAGLIGWLVMERLVLRPLGRLQKSVDGFDIAHGPLRTPALKTPSQEIRSLAQAFTDATARQIEHEAELAESLARQRRLTREVHHRVKNNLQVVASLINLHARGAHGPETSEAYAVIQRRVDALAVVHRNHYAEMEDNRGVDLRALIGELASNLRATASGDAAAMPIRMEVISAVTSQDIAVPVAFLITEVAEMAMYCDPAGGLTIRLSATDLPDRALLELIAPGLIGTACREHPAYPRFERVADGLARQLRASLHRGEPTGEIAITIAIIRNDAPSA